MLSSEFKCPAPSPVLNPTEHLGAYKLWFCRKFAIFTTHRLSLKKMSHMALAIKLSSLKSSALSSDLHLQMLVVRWKKIFFSSTYSSLLAERWCRFGDPETLPKISSRDLSKHLPQCSFTISSKFEHEIKPTSLTIFKKAANNSGDDCMLSSYSVSVVTQGSQKKREMHWLPHLTDACEWLMLL